MSGSITIKDSPQAGLVMIGLVFTMVVVSALTVAMLSQTSTTTLSQALSSTATQAFYAAESGYRYAASKIKHGEDMKTDLDGRTFSMGTTAGSFDIDIYPYFYETTSAVSSGSTTFSAQTPGGVESSAPFRMDNAASGFIKIVTADKSTSAIYSYTTVVDPGKTATFTGFSPPLPALAEGTAVLPVVISTGSDQSGVGGATALALSTATDITDIFPKYNGAFKVDGDDTVYLYKERDDINNSLTGITEALGSGAVHKNVAASTKISLEKFIKLKSTGSFANTSREIVYNIPFPESFQDVEFQEAFDDTTLSSWNTEKGSFTVGTADGGSALKVTGTDSAVGGPKASLIAFDWSSAGVDFGSAYRYGNTTYISYDAQVKVGFETTAIPPDWGYDPTPIPKYFIAGLNVRLEDADHTYGVSFMRGSSNTAPLPDNIEDNLVPVDQQLLLTFWQQTGNTGDLSQDITWLAYKELQPVFYSDHMEAVWENWNYNSVSFPEQQITWTYSPPDSGYQWATITYDGYNGSSNSLHHSPAGLYANNLDIAVYTGTLDLSETQKGILSFRHKYEIEAKPSWTYYDYGYVSLSTDNGSTWNIISPLYEGSLPSWTEVEIDISHYLDQTATQIKIAFYLHTDSSITRDGWYIDDVKIYKEIPVQQSTLMARIQETMSFSFENGYSGTGLTVQDGDWISDGSLVGYVDGDPILVGGAWDDSSNKAEGIIKLRNASGCFSTGTGNIQVIGKSGLTADVIKCSERDNFIRVFYGDISGYGTANSEPFDDEKLANARGQVNWPAGEINDWKAVSDYFTAVEWDYYRDKDIVSPNPPTYIEWDDDVTADTYSIISSMANGQQRSQDVIRINTLSSPLSPPFTQPELGLHTFGKGSTNIYFDDFGVKLSVGSERKYAPVVQE